MGRHVASCCDINTQESNEPHKTVTEFRRQLQGARHDRQGLDLSRPSNIPQSSEVSPLQNSRLQSCQMARSEAELVVILEAVLFQMSVDLGQRQDLAHGAEQQYRGIIFGGVVIYHQFREGYYHRRLFWVSLSS
ncbi:hypothetical protein Trydic_g1406 [Trypoxylus dichotomus]